FVPIKGLRSMNCLLECARRMTFRGTIFVASLVVVSFFGNTAAAGQTTETKPVKKATEKAADKPADKPVAKPAAKKLYSAERSMTRKANLARARAQAEAREIAAAQLPRYKTDGTGDIVPDVRAAAAIIYDPDTGKVLWEENSQDQRSIASITKIMT